MSNDDNASTHGGTVNKFCSFTASAWGGGGNDLQDTMMDEAGWSPVSDDSSLVTIEKNNITIIKTRIGVMFLPQLSTKEPEGASVP